MLSHFHYREIKNNMINREWSFEFYYKQQQYKGSYYKDGSIKWTSPDKGKMSPEEQTFLESCVHDLMLYHVYEDH
ncbi:hypothetical protein CR205_09950 [Alteribacter lacisalsi]|uniref:YheE family protein n=1 Tax=Alteribacter lacisalsi TaxID=2045244 RepID=A0A2W0HPS2_9BACI|nr:DUF5342 family protein [Alteribacter lacisalsi]PYZ98869.1 hypothetical protein CR205_09950 [Alteribacter lacisalsi]